MEYLGFSGGRINAKGARDGQEIGEARPPPPLARLALSWSTRKAVDALLLPQER